MPARNIFAEACHACGGRGIIDKLKNLDQDSSGADTGTVLRYRGEGARSNDGRAEIFVSSSG